MTSATGQLVLVRGTVTATKDRMESVRVDRKTGYGNIRTTPELWLRDEGGTEHRYSGDLFGAAQPGHDVAVVIKRTSGRPVAFANFTSNWVQDAKELKTSTSISSILGGAVVAAIVLALPGLFVWGALAEPFGLQDAAFTGTGFQIYAVVLLVSAFIGMNAWAKGYRERTDALKAEIDSLLVAAQAENV
ncbi:hypothetical protein [Tateyamaria omphalii]|uniref:hypothetical protein n=1 Tax=Tateyamaria omphalii TaxID=299262 RepID=UPI0016762AFE|nr:hypothetical protein [Tateyamaria omphalii]